MSRRNITTKVQCKFVSFLISFQGQEARRDDEITLQTTLCLLLHSSNEGLQRTVTLHCMQSVLNDKSRLDYIICILSQYDLHCTELLCICIMLTQNITESCYKKFDANAGHQRSVEAKFLKIPKMFFFLISTSNETHGKIRRISQ